MLAWHLIHFCAILLGARNIWHKAYVLCLCQGQAFQKTIDQVYCPVACNNLNINILIIITTFVICMFYFKENVVWVH